MVSAPWAAPYATAACGQYRVEVDSDARLMQKTGERTNALAASPISILILLDCLTGARGGIADFS